MPWRGPRFPNEFPTLGFAVLELIMQVCAVPDREGAGDPFIPTDEQGRFALHFYRIDPDTGRFFYPRGGQLVRPHKWGKGPFAAALICAEAHPDGPVLFDGWNADGEPVGRPWPTPHIQVAGISEDQTDNVFRALLPMIELGALRADIPDTGLTRVNLPSGGIIEPVTASALSRLGQRTTFQVHDQTESWNRTNKGRVLADNMRRGLASMGGRFLETPNAWDPREESVAQVTTAENGVHVDDVDPGRGSVRNKQERRKMLRRVYGDSVKGHVSKETKAVGWVDLDRIDDEIQALLKRDPQQAERWFLNRKQAGEDRAFDPYRIDELARHVKVEDGRLVTIGVDGARFRDAFAVVATAVESGHQWPIGIWERPAGASDRYEHPADEIDGAVTEAFERFNVWRMYVDPQWIDNLMEKWQGRWGDKRVIGWHTNRPRQIAWAVRSYAEAVGTGVGDQEVTGDATLEPDPVFLAHLKNARRKRENVYDEDGRQMHSLAKEFPDSTRKIDGAMAAVLSWEARGDAVAAGATDRSIYESRGVVTV